LSGPSLLPLKPEAIRKILDHLGIPSEAPRRTAARSPPHRQAGPLVVPDEFRPATFGVSELPSMRFEVFRALDGERVFGTSPD